VDLGAHLVLFNLAAPHLEVHGEPGHPTVDFPRASWGAFRPAGLAHADVWIAILASAVFGLISSRRGLKGPSRAVFLWLAMNAALHSVFGLSLFLYSCPWTFAGVAFAALGAETWAGEAVARRQLVERALALVVVLQAWANVELYSEFLSVFA
jgi:hypothetical protein